jgi:twitching motility protein PilT
VDGPRPGVGVSNLRLTREGGVTDVNLSQLLKAAVEFRASELMMIAHAPPALRVDGELVPLKVPPLSPEGIKALVFKVLKPAQQAAWEKDRTLRIAFGVKDLSRFRMTVYEQRETMAATVKVVPSRLPTLDPALERMKQWLQQPAGLYLIAGKSDSGRTWAFSALMDQVLVNEKVKLVVAQDPIEFVLPHKNSFVEQFEAGFDFQTAEQAVERLMATSGDVFGWDFPLNHGASLVTLAQSGKRVIATMLAASAEQAVAEILRIAPGAAPLIQEVAYLELSPPAKGRPRELQAAIGSLQALRSPPAMALGRGPS